MKYIQTALFKSVALMAVAILTIATYGSAATFQGLGYLPNGTSASYAEAISVDGKVVVGSSWAAPGSMESQPFRWTASDGMTTLAEIGGWASAISSDGSVIVGAASGQIFRWTASGGVVGLGGLPGSFYSEVYGISADGSVVVGYSEFSQHREAFIWTADEGMSELEELSGSTEQSEAHDVSSDGRTVVGWRSTDGGRQAFQWTASGGITYLTDGAKPMDAAYATSGDGSVIVGENGCEALYWTASDGVRSIPVAGRPLSVSADGNVVVGEGLFGVGCYEAFVWTESLGAMKLNDMLASVMPDGWFLYRATDLAVNGNIVTVVGHGTNPSGKDEAWVATFSVPESSSVTALLCGMSGTVCFGIRRRLRS